MFNNNRKTLAALIVCLFILTGCFKVGPTYQSSTQRGSIETDDAFENTSSSQQKLDPAEVIQVDWWTNFKDKNLNRYVKNAIQGNYGLRILLTRINSAGAIIDQSEADLYPTLDIGTSGSFGDNAETGSSTSYRAGGDLNWELDLWGKKSRKVAASKAEQKAVKADYRAGYLKLVSDVGVAYFTIRQYDTLIDVATDYLTYQQLIENIYKQQVKEGIINTSTLLRHQALVKTTKQDRLEMKRGREIQEHKLAALLGKPPGKVKVTKAKNKAVRPVKIPVGLPSSLLERRPDILAAEYRLAKATEKVGIAEAARFPSISLSAEGGLTSAALSTLLSGGFYALIPKISLPIFDGGKRKAEVKQAEYNLDMAKNLWAKTANEAFQEVADSLTNIANRKEQLALLQSQVVDLTTVKNQLKNKLELGLVSQLELNDVIQSLYDAKKNAVKMETSLMSDTIFLYKALGGGWPSEAVK